MNVGNDDGGSDLALLDLLPKQVRVDPMFQRKSRYRNAKLKACRHKTLLRGRLKAPATVPTNKPHPQFLFIVAHHKVSTDFGGHLMHHSTQSQKVRRNSRSELAAAMRKSRRRGRAPHPEYPIFD
jgi:hypothetical protein